MIHWYLSIRKLLRDIEQKSRDALKLYEEGGSKASSQVNEYLKSDYAALKTLWAQQSKDPVPSYLGRHISFGMDNDYRDILKQDLSEIEAKAEGLILAGVKQPLPLGFENLLHAIVRKNCYALFREGHLREAVMNSITALFDHIRSITNLKLDGGPLIDKAFSLEKPYLILSELESDSGQNDQKGFMQVFKGAFQGIRNPKAHSLDHDLTEEKAAQYLVFASLLARRIDEARVVKKA